MKTKRGDIHSEKPVFAYGQRDPLPVMEHFYTLQGEGAWTGTAAYFVRLAGCDVGCHWCDVKESWGVENTQYSPVADMIEWIQAAEADRVVITGGEPTIYDLSLLTQRLQDLQIQVHIETAGPHPLVGQFDWITLSPKKFLQPDPRIYPRVDELKVVIYNRHDFEWATQHAERCPTHTQLFLQPEWDRREQMTPLIVDYVKQHPQWRISLQTHKYLDIP